MAYEFLTEYKSNHFYSLSESELEEAQKDLEIPFPKELVKLYKEIGYGF